jgi:DedD protein
MRGVFEETELERSAPHRDTELTLGPTTLLAIFFGLVLLCGLCFGLGYSAAHRGDTDAGVALPGSTPDTVQAGTAHPKPSANAQPDQPSAMTAPLPAARADAEPPPAQAETETWHARPAAPAELAQAPAVKPALGAASAIVPAVAPPASAVSPALASASGSVAAGSIMVQIAAVGQPEDADVLMSALRKRNYTVVSRREPLDGLIHVRIGPFKTRVEAETWRSKLLNDGYNAIVQQ